MATSAHDGATRHAPAPPGRLLLRFRGLFAWLDTGSAGGTWTLPGCVTALTDTARLRLLHTDDGSPVRNVMDVMVHLV